MVWHIISSYRTSALTLASTDDVIVAAGVVLAATDLGIAIQAVGSGHAAQIYGAVIGLDTGMNLGPTDGRALNQYLLVGATGSVSGGEFGVVIAGENSRVVNHGSISGGNMGLVLNTGPFSGPITIFNDGHIDGAQSAIGRTNELAFGPITLHNTGVIAGGVMSYSGTGRVMGDSATDIIRNKGMMVGNVGLGGGNDIYDGRGGGVVIGTIYGDYGNDRFYLGAAAETIDGGGGIDIIDFSTDTSVRLALDGSVANTGSARGDVYSGIFYVIGTESGDDYIAGNKGYNTLNGLGGDDSLVGGSGTDTITGGAGSDFLFGGADSDRFYYAAETEGGDRIADFSNVTGNNDAFVLAVRGFGAGIIPGLLVADKFYHGTTNICTGYEDRIILRTTDNTVWFDKNGARAGGLTMLADVQAGVVISAADFLFV